MTNQKVSRTNLRTGGIIDDVSIDSHVLDAHGKRSNRKLHSTHGIQVNGLRFEDLLDEKFHFLGVYCFKDLPILGENFRDQGTIIHVNKLGLLAGVW